MCLQVVDCGAVSYRDGEGAGGEVSCPGGVDGRFGGDGAEVGDAAVVVEAAAGIGGSSFLSVAWVPMVMPLIRVSSGVVSRCQVNARWVRVSAY